MFGGQRLWCNSHNRASPDGVNARDGKSKVAVSALDDRQSISAFFQFGVNSSGTLPVNQYFGMGLTGFGLVPHRSEDSIRRPAWPGHGSIRIFSTVRVNSCSRATTKRTSSPGRSSSPP